MKLKKILLIKNNKFPFYLILTLTLIFILSFYEELIIRFNFFYLDKLLINRKRLSSILSFLVFTFFISENMLIILFI